MKRIVTTGILILSHLLMLAQPQGCVSQDVTWQQLIGKVLILSRFGILENGCFGQKYVFTNPAKDKPVEQLVLKDATHFTWQYANTGDFERTCRIEGRELIVPDSLFGNGHFRISFAKDEVIYTQGDDGLTRTFYIFNPKPTQEMLPLSYNAKEGFCNGELDDLLQYATDNTYLKDFPMGRHYFNARALTPEMAEYLSKPVQPKLPEETVAKTYDVTLYPHGKPVVTDVNQKGFGDCNFVAVLTDMAYLYPDFIQSIISKQKDGTFRVKMFDPQGNRITVAVGKEFPVKNGHPYYSCSESNSPTWATVMEIAAIKYVEAYQTIGQVQGCNAEYMTPMFTGDGRSFCIQPGKLSKYELARMITTCLQNGIMVNGGFLKDGLAIENYSTLANHGHTFLLPQREKALYAIRNPWGGGINSRIMNVEEYEEELASVIDIRLISAGAAARYFHPENLRPIDKSLLE